MDGITITINAATEQAVAKLNQFFGGVTQQLNGLTKASEFLSGLGERVAAALTLGAVVDGFKRAIDSMEDLGKAAQKTGLSLNALQALKKIGRNEGVPFEDMTLALSMLNDKIFQAIRLGGDAARPFRDLGIELHNADGSVRGMLQVLTEIGQKFHDMPDGIQKTAASMEFFGRGGREMIPAMNDLPQSLPAMMQQGGAIKDDDVKKAKEFNETLKDVAAAYNQIFMEVAKDILPILQNFADYLNSSSHAASDNMTVAQSLGLVFRVLASVVNAVYGGLDALTKLMGGQLNLEWDVLVDALGTVKKLFAGWWELLKGIIGTLGEMASKAANVSSVISKMASGDFAGAWKEAQKTVKEVGLEMSKMGSQVVGGMADAAVTGLDFAERSAQRAKDAVNNTWNSLLDAGEAYQNRLNAIWAKGPSSKSASSSDGSASSGAGKSNGIIVSDEANKLNDQVLKAFQEATLGKLQLLDYERDEMKKRLTLEVTDKKTLADDLLMVDQTYAAKKRQLIEQQQAEEINLRHQSAKIQLDRINTNPDLTEKDKAAQMLPVLREEMALLQQEKALENSRAVDSSRTPEEKLQAEKEVLRLKQDELQLTRQIQQLESQDFTGKMREGLTQLQSQWENLGGNFAGATLDAIKQGVNGITQSIMGALDGTRTWGQVFLQVGRSIIASIINIVVQWVAQMTIIAALKKLFGTQDKSDASQSAASWAPAAIAASIASYGSASAIGAAAFAAAMAAGVGLASGLSGFAEGGLVSGPGSGKSDSIFARLSNGEYVTPADVVQHYGTRFFDTLKAKRPLIESVIEGAHGIDSRVIQALTRPITSDPVAYQKMVSEAAAARQAGGGSGIKVDGHKVHVGILHGRSEFAEFMKSAEGEKIIVDTSKRKRLDIGIQT